MMDLHSEHMKMSTMEPLLELPVMAGKMAGEMAGKMAGVDAYLAMVLVHILILESVKGVDSTPVTRCGVHGAGTAHARRAHEQ